MGTLLERAYFLVCLVLGRLLRSARYSKARVVGENGDRHVRKHRVFFAPLLIWMGGPLVRFLDTGVRVLPQREWQERERQIYRSIYGQSVRVHADGVLVLPCFAGQTLAALLDDPLIDESARKRVIECAVSALADFHRLGLTHGDAMAENVMVDMHAGAARWFDFETIHESSRPVLWRKADDLRALLATCLLRTVPTKLAETLDLIVGTYGDDGVNRLLATNFASVLRRALSFHLAQAGLSFRRYREISKLLTERTPTSRTPC